MKAEAIQALAEAKMQLEQTEKDFNPEQDEDAEVELFIGATIGNQNDDTLYIDQTGVMPVPSFHGNQYQFIAYEYRSNAILVRALKDLSDNSMVEAFHGCI